MAVHGGMKKNFIERALPTVSFISILFLFGIAMTLIVSAVPAFREYGIISTLSGKVWRPTDDPPVFGMWPLILSSFYVTFTAIAIAVPLGVGAAVYLAEIAPAKVREIIKPAMEVLAGIPSIVLGFFGIVFLAPVVKNIFHLDTGLTGFTAAILLAIMSVPTIASITEDAVTAVPKELRHASLALGGTKWETIIRVSVPAAKSGILTGIILGISRTMGETMTVLMAAGGSRGIPDNIFVPMRPMTACIAGEMGETVVGGSHYYMLFAMGLILFVFNIIFNIIAENIKKGKNK
ncbi:MAG TPA: phosphate ABC transporter permease subunit PstC [Candidatus Goldiibacteriota bacterium]|nr:phosphate ABC transporter permease subunit PstC [Candidatus Goldiibacteriota bacterium]HPN63668.1 phosphate ABC transporter permease subunit PstC [Candidatus Goldiibacteriota bacterium]HRQ44044.1 phosphate ABC transporter permease subunit PstC [Candidatus Goldiibacteriota bacterium]